MKFLQPSTSRWEILRSRIREIWCIVIIRFSILIILAKDKSVHNVVTDEKLLWADGVSYNVSDGYMYVSAAQVHLGAAFNNGKNLAKTPFYIFRFKPISKGVPFR